MKTKKVYAKQLDCDDTTIYCDDDAIFDNVCVVFKEYNRFSGYNFQVIEKIFKDIFSYSDYDLTYYYKNNLASLVIDNLKEYNKLSLKNAIELAQALKNNMQFNDFACLVLSKLYKSEYKTAKLYGCCQGDIATAFYDTKYIDKKMLDYIEAILFGTGTEIMIHDENTEPQNENDISGYTFYTAAYNSDDIKKEIAQYENCDINDVVLYMIKDRHTYTVTKYDYEVK